MNSNRSNIKAARFDEKIVSEDVTSFASFCISQVIRLSSFYNEKESNNLKLIDTNEKFIALQTKIKLFLDTVRRLAGLRTTELLQALAHIDKLSNLHWKKGRFCLTSDNIYLVLIIAIMISHKYSSVFF